MRKLTSKELISALKAVGVRAGDIVHVQSDLRRIGPVDSESTREGMLGFYLKAFQEVLGREGTITVGTSFEDYARHGVPFVREESPSRQGVFSEFIRTQRGAERSIHPIVSVTGLGARAAEICGGAHYDGFGYESPWGRLHRANAKILALGLGAKYEGGTTFFHYLEKLYGVPYQYTKIYTIPVYSAGLELSGPFTMSVRYLDFGITNDTLRFKLHLVETARARIAPVGLGAIFCSTCHEIIEEGVKCLNNDRYFLLAKAPVFRTGEIPMDGSTGPMQAAYDKGARRI